MASAERTPVIDAWAQPPLPGFFDRLPEVESLLRRSGSGGLLEKGMQPPEMIAAMDAAGIESVMLCTWCRPEGWLMTNDELAKIVHRYPDRLHGVAAVHLHRPMEAVRELRHAVRDLGFKALRVIPWLWNLPPNDRLYYPLYATCIELGIPFCTQVGQTGPRMPSEPGRPVPYLDQVALDFPELKIVAGHIGFPWTNEMIGLAMKHYNVYIDTSAWLPSYYPPELLQFMKTFGRNRVLFGSNFPHLPWDRTAGQARDLDVPVSIRKRFLRENAISVFGL